MIVSGTPVRRPYGQSRPDGVDSPQFAPSARLDFEAELGFVVGVPSMLCEPIAVSRFTEHVFGVCLVNDWSARDHPGLGERPARAVPRQVVRHHGVGLGAAAGRAAARPAAAAVGAEPTCCRT